MFNALTTQISKVFTVKNLAWPLWVYLPSELLPEVLKNPRPQSYEKWLLDHNLDNLF